MPGTRAGNKVRHWRPPHPGDVPSKRRRIDDDHALLLSDLISRLGERKCSALPYKRPAQSGAIQPNRAVDAEMDANKGKRPENEDGTEPYGKGVDHTAEPSLSKPAIRILPPAHPTC